MPCVYNLKTLYKVESTKQPTKEKNCIERRYGPKDQIAHSILAIVKETFINLILVDFIFNFLKKFLALKCTFMFKIFSFQERPIIVELQYL